LIFIPSYLVQAGCLQYQARFYSHKENVRSIKRVFKLCALDVIMPRRNRIHIPSFLWHITYRCHKKEHLLKFAKDRKIWRGWLFEAKKRYGLKVITYAVTCNHIHLLVVDSRKELISKSMQLVSGATGQAYNSRKNRKGAFWEDPFLYHCH